MNWFGLSVTDAFRELQTSERGMSAAEAALRLERYGTNSLPEQKPISRLRIFLHQFQSPLIYILIVAGIVALLLGEEVDASVIFVIVGLNAIIGYIQEYKAEKSVRALKGLVVQKAIVLRDGKEHEIPSEELVPGDVVLLSSGAKVPADLRLFEARELRVEEAMLTGESLPSQKHTLTLEDENITPGDQENMAFMGTAVLNGRGRGIVVETGLRTQLGKIASQVQGVETVKIPLQEKFDRFAQAIGILILGASVLLFAIGIWMGESIKNMFLVMVAAAVAAIPEGLPVVVTITLAIGMSRMASKHAIIRNLPSVETLGSTTFIGSDKTGTLTKNEMTVKAIFDGTTVYQVEGSGYDPDGEIRPEGPGDDPERLKLLLRIGLLCNESLLISEDGFTKVQGDPTEGALIVCGIKGGLDPEDERIKFPQQDIIPFESERGYMATLHRAGDKGLAFVKGAPEQVFSRCSREGMEEARRKAEKFAADGLRVLAMAFREVPAEKKLNDKMLEGLKFAGLQAMMDPPRPEVIEAISNCREAGIKVAMITGDHAATAVTIGRQLGIVRGDSARVLTGRDLEKMSDDELFKIVKEISIYARVAPEHKLRIVNQLKRHGDIVAVTGDGVNDAPALKAAHMGVAMGRTGTDVAKEASDMVVTDDNFASIFSAVVEGRIVFDNIRKVTFFLIPTGVAAILSIIGTLALGLPIPFVPAQLLWINLVTNGLQDVALAFEPGEKDVINRPPRNPRESIMSRLLIERTFTVGLVISIGIVYVFMDAIRDGLSLERARTISMTTLVFFQFFQAWNSRSEYISIFRISPFSNPFLLYSMIGSFLAQMAVLYIPGLQWIFRTEPLSLMDWAEIAIVSLSVVLVVEIDKYLRRRK